MKANIKFLLLIVFLCTVQCFNFADHFKICHRNDAQIDKCLENAIEDGFKLLGPSGLLAINVPPIDPLKISKISIGAGTSAVNLVQRYTNASVIGLSKLKVENAHFDFEKNTLSFTTKHPILKQEATYNINGKILVLPVYGEGKSIITFKNANIIHVISLEEENKSNIKYFKIKDYSSSLTVGGAHFDFKNLFNGDKKLGDNILKVVNENWNVIFEDVRDGINKSFSKIFQAVATALFSKIPVDDLLPN